MFEHWEVSIYQPRVRKNSRSIEYFKNKKRPQENYQYDAGQNLILTQSTSGQDLARYSTEATATQQVYRYDKCGNQTEINTDLLSWDYHNHLTSYRTGNDTDFTIEYYQYDYDKQRIRKLTVQYQNKQPYSLVDRIYFGDYLLTQYYQVQDNVLCLEAEKIEEIIAIHHQQGGVALYDFKTVTFQHHNHLRSVVLKTYNTGNRINFEEFLPYGESAFLLWSKQQKTWSQNRNMTTVLTLESKIICQMSYRTTIIISRSNIQL